MPRTPAWWFNRPLRIMAGLLVVTMGGAASIPTLGGTSPRSPDARARGQDGAGLLLDEYFRRFLEDRDLEAFRDRVGARYSEGTLCRFLRESSVASIRRGAVVALGSLGDFTRSNPALGHALRDSDPVVRRLAEDALWSLWFRADTTENNRTLAEVIRALQRGDLDRAEVLATRLIDVAPQFAEAYNQRAIIAFERGKFDESARDCRRVLELNPYHFGALGGLAQCELQLDRPAQALETLRRASKLQPYNTGIRDTIRRVAARIEVGEDR